MPDEECSRLSASLYNVSETQRESSFIGHRVRIGPVVSQLNSETQNGIDLFAGRAFPETAAAFKVFLIFGRSPIETPSGLPCFVKGPPLV